jgi:hypothetical protein
MAAESIDDLESADEGSRWPETYQLPPELVSAIGSVVPVDWDTLRAGSARNPDRAWLYFGLLANRVYEGALDLTDKLIEAYDMLPAVVDRSLYLNRRIQFQLVRLLVYDHMHGEASVADNYGLHEQLVKLEDDQLVRLDVMLAEYVLSIIVQDDYIRTQDVKFVTRLLVFVLCTRGANHFLYLIKQLIEKLDMLMNVDSQRDIWLFLLVYLLYTVARFDVSMDVKRKLMQRMDRYRLFYLGRGIPWLVDDPFSDNPLWSYTTDELNDWASDTLGSRRTRYIIDHPIDVRCDPDHMEITDEGEGDRIVATIIGRLPSRHDVSSREDERRVRRRVT